MLNGQVEVIDNGNVGIGIENPIEKLHVENGDIFLKGKIKFVPKNGGHTTGLTGEDASARIAIGNYKGTDLSLSYISMFGDENWTNGNINRAGEITIAGSYLGFRTGVVSSETSPARFGIERMRINASGNVGIGTINPTQRLEVAGNILTTSGMLQAYPKGNPTGDARVEIGAGRTADGNAYIDLVGDESAYSDFGLRLFRTSTGNSIMIHRGAGVLLFNAPDVGSFIRYNVTI